jgi:hypothetical protein
VPSRLLLPQTTVVLGPNGEARVDNAPLRPTLERAVHGAATLGLLATAALGVLSRRRVIRDDAILWSIRLTFVLVHTVNFPATRYGTPVLFVLMFYAAVGLDRGLRLVERRRGQA